MIPFSIVLLLVLMLSQLGAQIELTVTEVRGDTTHGAVGLKLKNTFTQEIRSARVWVLAIDSDGKVAGTKAQWIVGGDTSSPGLSEDAEENYLVPIQAERPFSTAKVTFSRIILEDGSSPNPKTSVVDMTIN